MNIEKTEALASGNDIENPTIVYKEDKKRGFSLWRKYRKFHEHCITWQKKEAEYVIFKSIKGCPPPEKACILRG